VTSPGCALWTNLSFESLSFKVVELGNDLCNQDKLICKVFRENKRLNLELENSFAEITSLRSMHDDMSAKPCKNYNMVMVNYADLWIVHTQVASQLKGAKLELKELKARSLLLGACTNCPTLKSNLEACSIEIGSLKGKFFHATKENTELKQEVAYLTSRFERTVVSEKIIEDDLNHVEESATNSTYKLGVGFERCEDKGEKSPKFVPSSNYHKEDETLKSNKTHYPSNPKPSFNLKREIRKETPKPREETFICMFCGRAGHLDEFYSITRE
jgi:regulator of replication initiation timing